MSTKSHESIFAYAEMLGFSISKWRDQGIRGHGSNCELNR